MLLAFFMLSPLGILGLFLFACHVDPKTGHFLDKTVANARCWCSPILPSGRYRYVCRNTQMSADGMGPGRCAERLTAARVPGRDDRRRPGFVYNDLRHDADLWDLAGSAPSKAFEVFLAERGGFAP
jgi:hypothetical protein